MGANPEEDPQDFIDEMHKTLRVMHATEIEGVELAAYYHFLPAETRAARAAEFENLKQGSRSVLEYHMEFARMSKYVIHMLPTMEPRVRGFVQGLNPLTINKASTAALNSDMNYEKIVAFSQAIENRKLKNRMEREGNSKARSTSNMGESLGGGRSAFRGGSSGSFQSVAQSSASALYQGPTSSSGVISGPRHCRVSRQGAGRCTIQSSSPAVATSSAPSPARGAPTPVGRGAARGGVQSSGGPNRFYAMSGRQTLETSLDVVTGILTVQSHDVYALIDPGSTLSYVTPFAAMEFGIEPDQLHDPFLVSTRVGESITAARVYRGCVVTVWGRDTTTDLIKLGMVDFDVIMVMDWLYS
ncbi:uncharacterized protein [Nicotiana sylvestris]|uniref:uncharacterized protein n=1 Tax=Nicotiana sylvestris TaxID=4096 RepID=UPI00388CAD23